MPPSWPFTQSSQRSYPCRARPLSSLSEPENDSGTPTTIGLPWLEDCCWLPGTLMEQATSPSAATMASAILRTALLPPVLIQPPLVPHNGTSAHNDKCARVASQRNARLSHRARDCPDGRPPHLSGLVAGRGGRSGRHQARVHGETVQVRVSRAIPRSRACDQSQARGARPREHVAGVGVERVLLGAVDHELQAGAVR